MPRPSTTLQVGDPAPDFCLPDTSGATVCLADLRARGPVLVFFFRGTFCPNCRRQWRELMPWTARFLEAGATPIGIVAQSPVTLRAYEQRHRFPFPMLADLTRDTIRAYGVWHIIGLDALNVARPSTFLIDQAGVIRWISVSRNQLDRPQAEAILEEARRIGVAGAGRG